MGRRGPRPIPTAIKIAKGTIRGTDRPNETTGATVPMPEAPDTLGDAGRAAWAEYGGIAASLGLLEPRFLPGLERLSEAWQRAAEATPHGMAIVLENDPLGKGAA